jgi:hypothetical protein
MSFTATHAARECGCFSRTTFSHCSKKEHAWMQLLFWFTRRRVTCPNGAESELIAVMLRERTRCLRN